MAICVGLILLLVGFITLKTLSIEQYPDIAPPTISVSASYTGADAQTVMNSVVMPLEESINGVEDMMYITSDASSTGDVTINVYFKQGTDADMACVNVQNRVSKAQALLPGAVVQNGISVAKQQNSMLQINSLVSRDSRFDQSFISNYLAINVKPRLLRIGGVGGVTLLGNTYSLRIWFKPDILAQYSLTPEEVIACVNEQSLVAPTGSLGENSSNTFQYTLEYKGTLSEVSDYQQIVIKSLPTGEILRLEDVADVELGSISYSFSSSVDGAPGVPFIINQASGANATATNAEIDAVLADVEAGLPDGLEFCKLETSDDFLFAAIHNVVETLIIAIILVILVVYFFLQDFKATLIPSVSIIVSLLGTFAIVKMAGFSLNILTLFALVLAIGTVVDDAIVVVEAVMAKFDAGYTNPRKATNDALAEVKTAVISCTLVFMAVFIPVTFMPGTSGTFFTQFGITLASSVGLSCISALTICPAMCVMLMRPAKENGRKNINYYVKSAYTTTFNALMSRYKNSVVFFIRKPRFAIALLAVAVGVMVWAMIKTPSGLVPQEDQGVMLVDISTPPGSTLQETEAIVSKVEKQVSNLEEVEHYTKISGYGIVSGVGVNNGTLVVRLKNWEERKGIEHSIDMVMYKFMQACEPIKEATIFPTQMPQIPGYGNGNAISLVLQDRQGGSVSDLNAVAQKMMAELQKRPEIGMAMNSFSDNYPKFKVEVDAAQCKRAGISPQEVLAVLGTYCGGYYVGNFNLYGQVYRVMGQASPESRLNESSLDNIFVRVGDKMSPISQFVTLSPSVGPYTLSRFNLFTSITCNIMPADGYSSGQVQEVIAEVAKDVLPAGYGYEYSGMAREEQENSQSNMTVFVYLICVILIYIILASLYESWFVPFAVLLSVPFGLMGSFLFTCLFGMENNIYLQTGVIMLIGLLAKTAILITEFAVDKRKAGLSITEAAFAACEDRLRPILMTVLSMVIGMIPLIIESGAGARGNRSLAIGVVFGMIVGTIALLFVVPAFYILFQKLHEKIQGPMIVEDEESLVEEKVVES